MRKSFRQTRRRTSDNREHCPLCSTRKPITWISIKRLHEAIFETLVMNRGILGSDKVVKDLKTATCQNVKFTSIRCCKAVHSTKPFHMDGMMKWN